MCQAAGHCGNRPLLYRMELVLKLQTVGDVLERDAPSVHLVWMKSVCASSNEPKLLSCVPINLLSCPTKARMIHK